MKLNFIYVNVYLIAIILSVAVRVQVHPAGAGFTLYYINFKFILYSVFAFNKKIGLKVQKN